MKGHYISDTEGNKVKYINNLFQIGCLGNSVCG